MAFRALTIEEAKKLGPPNEAQVATQLALAESIRRAQDEYVAAGGYVMTDDEFQSFWADVEGELDDRGARSLDMSAK